MTKNEIIEKTLKEIGFRLDEHEEPYSEEPDWEEIVIAELQERLPDTGVKTCEDFRHLNVTCCDTCHTFYPHYEMSLIDLPDSAKAWVCDPVKWAIYPEQYQKLQEWEADIHRGQTPRAYLRRGRRQIDHSRFRRGAAEKVLQKEEGARYANRRAAANHRCGTT